MTLKNNRAPLLYYFKLFASFHSHRSIQSAVTVRQRQICVKIGDFLPRVTLKFDRWPWKTIGHLFYATLSSMYDFVAVCEFKVEFTVRKRLSWVLTSVTLTFDLWPWPFARTSLLSMVITPENFMMIRYQEHSETGVTDGQTDGQTDRTIHRAAWSQLKPQTMTKMAGNPKFDPFH